MGAIALKSVEKWFGTTQVIRGIDLDIKDGEFVVFVGPSGCGKSTLLRMIGGLEDISRGQLVIDDIDMTGEPPIKRGLTMVFQSYALYPHMSVGENMGFALKVAGEPRDRVEAEVARAAEVLKLTDFLARRPRELSGGQRQRVAIGRSIVRNPTAFLFDEPLSNLDAALRVEMRYELAKLHERLARTMIYVTHDQVEAMTLADRIVVLADGRVAQIGTPRELYRSPANLFVAGFIGSPKMNLLRCEMQGDNWRLPGARGGTARVRGQATCVGIRPEHITLGSPGSGVCDGRVDLVEYLGADSFVVVDCGAAGSMTLRLPGEADVRSGDMVGLEFTAPNLHFFGNDGRTLPCA